MTLLSACLIIKNEEKWLDQCLNSLSDAVDEIIIVDTGSTDKSKEIAEKYNCKIFDFTWTGSFSAARNYAIEQAQGEWIISIDADETLINGIDLPAYLRNIPLNVGGVLIERENLYTDFLIGKSQVEVRSNLRIFRNNKKIRWNRNVHEHVSFSIRESGFEITSSPFKILHHLNELNEDEFIRKQKNYLSILENDTQAANKLYNLFFKAQTYHILKDRGKARIILDELLDLKPSGNLLFLSLSQFAIICLELQDLLAAREKLALSIDLFPEQSFGYFLLSQILFRENKFEEALSLENKWILSGEKVKEREVLEGDLYLAKEQAAEFKGICYLRSAQLEKAIEELKEGLTGKPQASGCYLRSAQVHFMSGNFKESISCAERAIELNPGWKEASEFLKKIQRINSL
ncbi:MAG: glycosyl transferase family 2 [Bacteroidetes bacterium]|jgi:glycosyltransferase involved in cell wall biosynthesis|nr:glycosyl transferase family 2 [Bacteroidota bacterium]